MFTKLDRPWQYRESNEAGVLGDSGQLPASTRYHANFGPRDATDLAKSYQFWIIFIDLICIIIYNPL